MSLNLLPSPRGGLLRHPHCLLLQFLDHLLGIPVFWDSVFFFF